MSGNKRMLVAGVLAGLVAGGSGVAVANVSADDGVINACVSANGSVRILSNVTPTPGPTATPTVPTGCGTDEKKVSWNQAGPAGQQGLKGDAAVAGSVGSVRMLYGGSAMLDPLQGKEVFKVALEPGSYRADAQIAISPWGDSQGKEYIGDCVMAINGRGFLANSSTTSHRLYLQVHSVFTLTSADTLRVTCTGGPRDKSFPVRVGGLSSVTVQQVPAASMEYYNG
ncbi:hypothetical protein [Nonomuraea sp. NPDC046570]|uniref:hypothetical protein n=1 Tax=Nonomuraea sp. NPDC046570 TaxID=3155255 RepID=UPI0033C7E131